MSESSTRTVERALSLLAAICEQGNASLAESARAVDLPASTALRLLRTLEGTGFVRRDDRGDYRPGSRLIQLGAQALSDETLVTLCREPMEELVEATGESVYLSVEGHDRTALYIAIVEGTHSVRHTSWVGRTIPLEGSAAGAALQGTLPESGYVVVERGIERDVTAIAAPISTAHHPVAALSLLVPSYRLTPLDVARFGQLLAERAARVSRLLGDRGKATA